MTALIILILVLVLSHIQAIKFGVVLGQISQRKPMIEAINILPNGDTRDLTLAEHSHIGN